MAEATPDVLVIGDSHTTALWQGCVANGLNPEVLCISGNIWHAAHLAYDEAHGIWARSPAHQRNILALRQRLGGDSLAARHRPVIASIGFHLGRLVPPLSFRGHVTERQEFMADDTALFISSTLLRAYVRRYRAPQLKLLRRLSRATNLVVVAPPEGRAGPNYAAVRRCIVDMMRESGITVYDPGETGRFALQRPLPDEYLAADKAHANERYGAGVVADMLEAGLVTLAAKV